MFNILYLYNIFNLLVLYIYKIIVIIFLLCIPVMMHQIHIIDLISAMKVTISTIVWNNANKPKQNISYITSFSVVIN